MSLHTKFTKKCAKLVDENNNQLFCCVSDIEPKVLIKGVHLTNLKKTCLIESYFFSYEEMCTYYVSEN